MIQNLETFRSLPIEAVAADLGIPVVRHLARCPFHEDRHPSLHFHVGRNTFHCFACNAHGGPIDLVMHRWNISLPQACRWLEARHHVILSMASSRLPLPRLRPAFPVDTEYLESLVARPVLSPEARQFLFQERHYRPEVVRWLGITSISHPMPCWRYGRPFYDAPALLIPYRSPAGKLITVQSRYLGPSVSDKGHTLVPVPPRFRFPSGGRCGIYNLPVLMLLQPGEPLYIAEGVTDCMALLSAGHKAIAIPSATLLTQADREALRMLADRMGPLDLHIYPDADEPGERLFQSLLQLATSLGTTLRRHSLPAGCKDYSDLFRLHHESIQQPSN
ncbi:MAG: CHC2 zinc finger domain-containing protein [Bacteroidaceae bacterium]